jgi:hypothetical protein
MSLFPHFWNSFHRYHFSIYIHVYTVFATYTPSYTLFLPPLPSHSYQPPHPRKDLSTLLFSDFVKEKMAVLLV